jgi:hypothetical protein
MANASFYRPKFGTIDLMTNCWVGGHILTWWQSLSSCLNKISLLTSEFEQIVLIKVLENCLNFPKKTRCNVIDAIKLEHYKESKQENDLDLKTKMPKWMANASFYRLKFRTIHLVIDYWCSGQLLI